MGSSEESPTQHLPLLYKQEKDYNLTDFELANYWSRLTFKWLNPVFEKGSQQRLELEHVPSVPNTELAENSFALLQESLQKQKEVLSRAILHAIWRPLIVNAFYAGLNTGSSYLGPFLITNFVELLSDKEKNNRKQYGCILACLFLLAKMVESLSQRQWYFGARKIGILVRSSLMASIYNKTLSVKNSRGSTGKIINLLDVDIERVGDFFWHIHGIWLLPFQILLALAILYRSLGAAASVATLLTTCFVMISNMPLANSQKKLNSKIMEAKDSRIKATAEILKSMRILKLYAWEGAYLDKLLKLRDIESNYLKKYLYTCSAIAFLFWTSPTLVSVSAFGVCTLVQKPLTAGTVLSAVATFRILQDPIYNLPELVSMTTQTRVSIDRITEVMNQEDQTKPCETDNTQDGNTAIVLDAREYKWEDESSTNKITLKIEKKICIMRGEKVAVCGPVGSGKTSLLCSIMGEMPSITGTTGRVFRSRAYASQSAWIQTGTIQENVLFGKEMDKGLYEEVLEACGLDTDVRQWVKGDLMVVGERGVNLSGGQKQRIQLARALYSNSDMYLLDDPFSAVDAHTGAHLFKECLMGLMSTKTVVYVTHQLEFLQAADLVLVMKDGRIVQSGKYEDLISANEGELAKQMATHEQSLTQMHRLSIARCSEMKNEPDQIQPSRPMPICDLVEISCEEERESGRVKWNVYHTFITSAFCGALVPVILVCHTLFQALQMGGNYWIAWASERGVTKAKLIGFFALLSAGSSAFILVRAILLSTIAIETAQQLFVRMTRRIFRVPIHFFDLTPSSRILNRCSTDQSTVDTDIPYRVAGLVFALIQLMSIIILMSQVAWPVSIVFAAALAISAWYQNYYRSTARELARMVGIRKAPILHHFSESIAGIATIRCFNQEERFFKKSLKLIDDYSRITFHNSATMEWLSVRTNFLFNVVFFVLLVILVSLPRNDVDPSLAGLAVTYGLSLNVLQAWVIWNLCNVENKMISVERILQISNTQSEAPLVIEEFKPSKNWPAKGTIEINNLHVKYQPELPTVLKGISCVFPGGTKVGVVGRTGSGKSTLIQALFRAMEPSEGSIIIDGVDISFLGLHDLRSKLSIIPQDPTLFQGTVRTNIDPLQLYSDADIWEVIGKCHLEDIVKEDDRRLDTPVVEEGGNWSVGQRQLICLARALLMKRKILVLDEATASVDTVTDNFIQKTIRQETSNSTVVSIAHRIPTVIESDLVLVLEAGRILEFNSPRNLLEDSSSAFSKLVMEYWGRSNKVNGDNF